MEIGRKKKKRKIEREENCMQKKAKKEMMRRVGGRCGKVSCKWIQRAEDAKNGDAKESILLVLGFLVESLPFSCTCHLYHYNTNSDLGELCVSFHFVMMTFLISYICHLTNTPLSRFFHSYTIFTNFLTKPIESRNLPLNSNYLLKQITILNIRMLVNWNIRKKFKLMWTSWVGCLDLFRVCECCDQVTSAIIKFMMGREHIQVVERWGQRHEVEFLGYWGWETAYIISICHVVMSFSQVISCKNES